MLVYTKNKKLFGNFGKYPTKYDEELIYLDEDGNRLVPQAKDTYVDNGRGGIIRRSDNKTVNVYVDDFKIIPPGNKIPQLPTYKKWSTYLYEINIDEVDYAYADVYFRSELTLTAPSFGNCTSV